MIPRRKQQEKSENIKLEGLPVAAGQAIAMVRYVSSYFVPVFLAWKDRGCLAAPALSRGRKITKSRKNKKNNKKTRKLCSKKKKQEKLGKHKARGLAGGCGPSQCHGPIRVFLFVPVFSCPGWWVFLFCCCCVCVFSFSCCWTGCLAVQDWAVEEK